MEDSIKGYIPVYGIPAMFREFMFYKDSLLEPRGLADLIDGVLSYGKFAFIAVENVAVVGGLSKLLF